MSTAFYVKLNTKKRVKVFQKVEKGLMDSKFDDCRKIIDLLELNEKDELQIGLRSSGWQFAWYHLGGLLFDLNLESLKNFLKNDVSYIFDEYGTKYTCEELFEAIEETLRTGLTNSEFYKLHPEFKSSLIKEEETVIIGDSVFYAHCGDFKTSDNLRFYTRDL